MTWQTEKTSQGQDLVWNGVEFGIGPSPLKGIANIQNANISTESGEVMASYARTAQQQAAISGGTLTPNGATNFTGPPTLKAGTWISVSASTVTSISTTTSPSTAAINYLAVGGGGAGGATDSGSGSGGGGGGGRVLSGSSTVAVGNYAITVGTGGVSVQQQSGGTGGTTTIGAIATAQGGAGGGKNDVVGVAAVGGGSGGGGGASAAGSNRAGGAGATGGNNGGTSNGPTRATGGGGGGAGGVGGNGTSSDGGIGGIGTTSSITGTSTYYGGGGGGGAEGSASYGTVNQGGGGIGGNGTNGTDGTANTGGGGGGTGGNGLLYGGDGGSGIAIISYTLGSMVAVGGEISLVGTTVVHTFRETGNFTVLSVNKTNLYYVSYASGTTFKLSAKFDPTGANALTHGTTGSITFSTVATPNSMVAKAIEKYTTASATEYRYYLLDTNSYVWVWDTAIYDAYGTQWMLPDPTDYSALRLTGLGALNGYLLAVGKAFIAGKPTVDLGRSFTTLSNVYLNEPFPTHNNTAIVGNQGKMYYCDGNYIGEVFPTTSLVTSIANIQSQCSYTASTTTGTVSAVISGSLPYSPDGTRIPAVFFTDVYGTQPTNLSTFTVYYIDADPASGTFTVYASASTSDTTAINLATGAAGNQFFQTFWPYGTTGVGGTKSLVQVSTQRVNLPANETAQCLVEIGNTVLIGGKTNVVYPWNQIDATPSDFVALPESDIKTMVNVNNIAYVFAGNKGNVYVCNGSQASLALKVPDYCAGVPGTPLTYIEPVYTWGDADYVRGRVYFSMLDQTATKAGNCGGIWSFVPVQNIDPSQDIGMALRLENQQSYGDYDGYATIILAAQEQNVTSPQYWAAWQDSYSTGTSNFGIDFTATTPVTQYVIETDLLPTGTLLDKTTFKQAEYKVVSPLLSGDSIQLYYRLNATDSWTSCDTVNEESADKISGYFTANFQKTQWTQLRAVVTTGGTTSSSFVRLNELRLR